MNNKSKYFFCYDKKMASYLINIKGMSPLTIALHPKTLKTFSMFEHNDQLQIAINEWNIIHK